MIDKVGTCGKTVGYFLSSLWLCFVALDKVVSYSVLYQRPCFVVMHIAVCQRPWEWLPSV